MLTSMMNGHDRLQISCYYGCMQFDDHAILAVHRMCSAVKPILDHNDLGWFSSIKFTDEDFEIEFVVSDANYAMTAMAPVMGCFAFMSEGVLDGAPPSATYRSFTREDGIGQEVEIDLKKYLPQESCAEEIDL